jgi:hypothetical protein
MKISVTERATFKKCRKRWEYQFVRNLVPIQEDFPALWIGTGVHAALEEYYCGDNALAALNRWWVENIANAPTQVQMSPEATWDLMSAMVGGYAKFAATEDQDWEVLATEHRLHVPIPGTTDGVLSGRMDLLIRWNGKVWVVDHKTAAAFVDEATLEFDDQMTAYIWMVHESTGEEVSGAVYNQLKKKIPEKPLVLQNGSLSKNKQQSTTHHLYREAIEELDLNLADYTEILDHFKKNNAFFRREYLVRNAADVKTFVRELAVEYSMMVQAKAYPAVFCHRSLTRDCGWCPFRLLCKSESSEDAFQAKMLQDALFVQKEETNGEGELDDVLSTGAREDHPVGNGSR